MRMSTRNSSGSSARHAGFSLIELMVTMLVVAILASIAVPTYTAQIRKSRRTEARSAILDLAGREERVLSVSNSYSQIPTDVGYTGTSWGTGISVGSGYYSVVVTVPDPNFTGTGSSYVITASAVGTQTADTSCASFSTNQMGKQSSLDSSSADSTSTCWK
jgi:type IV pilus assembly protein PilE